MSFFLSVVFFLSFTPTRSQAQRFPCLFFLMKKKKEERNVGVIQNTIELDSIFFCQGILFPKYVVTAFVLEYGQTKTVKYGAWFFKTYVYCVRVCESVLVCLHVWKKTYYIQLMIHCIDALNIVMYSFMLINIVNVNGTMEMPQFQPSRFSLFT